MAAPIPDAPSTIKNKGIIKKKKRGGRLDSCLPTKERALLQSKIRSLPETRLVGRFCIAAAAPPVSHHLNQQLPVSLVSHSQGKRPYIDIITTRL